MPKNRKNKTSISWQTPEYKYYPKSKKWIIVTGIISGLLFLFGIYFKNYLFSLFIGLSFFAVTIYAFRKPESINILINSKGVKIKNTLYKYENLSSFWIFYDPPIKQLSLKSKKIAMPYIRIELADQDPNKIRQVLIQHLPEKKHRESNMENIARQLKF